MNLHFYFPGAALFSRTLLNARHPAIYKRKYGTDIEYTNKRTVLLDINNSNSNSNSNNTTTIRIMPQGQQLHDIYKNRIYCNITRMRRTRKGI